MKGKKVFVMLCPYCDQEMKKGVISGDGRAGVFWNEGERKRAFIDKIGGSGKVLAAKGSLTTFLIEAYYCKGCKKMIFDTEIKE